MFVHGGRRKICWCWLRAFQGKVDHGKTQGKKTLTWPSEVLAFRSIQVVMHITDVKIYNKKANIHNSKCSVPCISSQRNSFDLFFNF